MGSRILPRGRVEQAAPMQWSMFGDRFPGTEPDLAPEPEPEPATAAEAANEEPVAALQHRIEELQRELPRREEQARSMGYREGEQAGARAAAAELQPVLARLSRTIEELAALRRRFRAEAERDILKLTLAISRRVLHREINVDAEAMLGLVRVALEQIELRELHRVRLHPVDAAAVERNLGAAGIPDRVEVVPDTTLERGAAIFETVRGSLDASITTQLAEIERGFGDLLEKQR
jgi:flagellar assembly protein FliH